MYWFSIVLFSNTNELQHQRSTQSCCGVFYLNVYSNNVAHQKIMTSLVYYLGSFLILACFMAHMSSAAEIQFSLNLGVNPSVGVLTVMEGGETYTIVETPHQLFTDTEAKAACTSTSLQHLGFVYYENVTSHANAKGNIATLNCENDDASSCKFTKIDVHDNCSECYRKASIVLRCYKDESIVFVNNTKPHECVLEGAMKTYFEDQFYETKCIKANGNSTATAKVICKNEGLDSGKVNPIEAKTGSEAKYKDLYLYCSIYTSIENCTWKQPANVQCQCMKNGSTPPRLLAVKCSFENGDRKDFCENGLYYKKKEDIHECLNRCTQISPAPPSDFHSTQQSPNSSAQSLISGTLTLRVVWVSILVAGLISAR
ncbi:uncharacterized protein [Antedon mediterranea]|uniref:uncharacterized protein n=1 Tax=Antedon mediterranea TaxID=105859 RepID=UPI003AF50433